MAVDMSPRAVEARLREAARISVWGVEWPPRVDMSPAAVEARLREVAQLHRLCAQLASGRLVDPG